MRILNATPVAEVVFVVICTFGHYVVTDIALVILVFICAFGNVKTASITFVIARIYILVTCSRNLVGSVSIATSTCISCITLCYTSRIGNYCIIIVTGSRNLCCNSGEFNLTNGAVNYCIIRAVLCASSVNLVFNYFFAFGVTKSTGFITCI